MSYLTPPQITFQGKAYANPSTANNNDYANVFDIDKLTINPSIAPIQGATVQIPAGQQTFNYAGSDDASGLRAWLMGLLNGIATGDGGPYGQQAHWNYYGDHATRFDDATVTGYTPASGAPIPPNDPLLGAALTISGNTYFGQPTSAVMVDVDPYALVTTQIFAAGLQVTAADGTPLIVGQNLTRACSYFIYVYKNVDPNAIGFQPVSCIFICSIPSANLQINPRSVSSPALADLAQAAAGGAGLQMRYCFYNAIYAIDPQQLQQMYAAGNYVANPYLGRVLGTIGVLQPGELSSAPPGRKLFVQNTFSYTLGPNCGQPPADAVPAGDRPPGKGPLTKPRQTTLTANLGCTPAAVDADNRVVWMDLVSTFPECNKDTNSKLDLGPMQLDLLYGAGQRVTIGPIPNDTTTYEATAGMTPVSWADNPQAQVIDQNIASGTLTIFSVNQSQDLLLEVPGIDIQTDDRALYFQEQGTATISIQVLSKGQPPQTATTVNLEYWMCAKDDVNPSKPQVAVGTRYFTVDGATQMPNTTYNLPWGTQSVITDQVTVPPGGQLTLTLRAANPGVSMIRFVDPQAAVSPNFAWDNIYYSIVRILPLDDFSGVPDSQVKTWQFMYENVFSYFSLLYPIMSDRMPWGPRNAPDDPVNVETFAAQILQLTDPKMWSSTLYMPITRELSAGKRALIVRWCSLVQGGSTGAGARPTT